MTGLLLEFTFLKSCRAPSSLYKHRDLEELGRFVLRAEKVTGAIELSLEFVNPERIRMLNRHFRGVDRTTDVISFRDELPPHPHPLPQGERESKKEFIKRFPSPLAGEGVRVRGFQGDIAINVKQAILQAKDVGHPARREIRLLWIHGILHLLGYTDYDPIPRRKMFKRQNELLRRWERR